MRRIRTEIEYSGGRVEHIEGQSFSGACPQCSSTEIVVGVSGWTGSLHNNLKLLTQGRCLKCGCNQRETFYEDNTWTDSSVEEYMASLDYPDEPK